MDPFLGAAAISGFANLLGIGASNAANAAAVEKYNEGQMELAKYQNEYNLEMWNRSNEYNSPVQQMQRLAQAKLNPNLVYGNGSVANTAGMPAPAAKPNLHQKNYDFSGLDALGSYLNIARMQKDIDVADQNIKESQAREANIREQTYGQGLSNKWLDASFDMRLDNLHQQTEEIIRRNLAFDVKQGYLPEMAQLEYQKLQQSLTNMVQQYANMCVQQQLTEAQIAYTWKQNEVANEMIQNLQARTGLTWEQAEKTYYDTMGSMIDNDKAVFGMMMDAARNPVVAPSIGFAVQSGELDYGWMGAIQHAQRIQSVPYNAEERHYNRRRGHSPSSIRTR